MIMNQEEDEFIAVRVQDPRIQNEGSWNSYVDYKIFLHTNSKAFTAKTSCVRRRYSEFVWFKKKLQKNAGLVLVPDLPGKSFFSFSNEDFLERRRKGLQVFLDKVVHMTVCVSDSQLHLFLQTQLPVSHIQDCVEGHTPYTVTDAILTYASSNRGLAQAQTDDLVKDQSLASVFYESMESPGPHQPFSNSNIFSSRDTDPLEGLLEVHNKVPAASQFKKTYLSVLKANKNLETIGELSLPTEVTFFLGDNQNDEESGSSCFSEQTCQIQTPVEVHMSMGTSFDDVCAIDCLFQEECTLGEEGKSDPDPDVQEKTVQWDDFSEVNLELISSEIDLSERYVSHIVDLNDVTCDLEVIDHHEDVCPQRQGLEHNSVSEVNSWGNVGNAMGGVAAASCLEEPQSSDRKTDAIKEKSENWGSERPLHLVVHEEPLRMCNVPEMECGVDTIQQMDAQLEEKRVEQEVHLIKNSTKDESDEDSQSVLLSSNESIIKVTDEDSICDETEDAIPIENVYLMTSPAEVTRCTEAEDSSILEVQMNGRLVENENISHVHSTQEGPDDYSQYIINTSDSTKSLDAQTVAPVAALVLTENGDFSILESSGDAGMADRNCAEQDSLSSLSLDVSKEGDGMNPCHFNS
ncbi:sorting nexin-11 [Thalassophryne amazonica]|uniref:sorting nexin-11 n=1 Tax=Thalassophryne amazonica TaxID=390379 RepID=UPI0014718D20|nr:sorting nexin-11 [Thalassophryne amazonica]